jgi:hypothetical protein
MRGAEPPTCLASFPLWGSQLSLPEKWAELLLYVRERMPSAAMVKTQMVVLLSLPTISRHLRGIACTESQAQALGQVSAHCSNRRWKRSSTEKTHSQRLL